MYKNSTDTSNSEKVTMLGKRMNISLTPIARDLLEVMSSTEGLTQSAIICRAISTEAYLKNEIEKGSKILVQDSKGNAKEIVFR